MAGTRTGSRNKRKAALGSSRTRTIIALVVVAAAYFLQDPVVNRPYHLTRGWLGIGPAPPHTLLCAAYNLLVIFRLARWLAITGVVTLIDGEGIAGVLRFDRRQAGYFVRGLGVGLAVMMATVLSIVAVGAAKMHLSAGTFLVHLGYGLAWLAGEIVGAAGEELLFRGLILVLTARLAGWPVGMVVSAAMFALAHGANPGASHIWMARLAAAGLLLAWSVWRSGATWWGTGCHAGWNLASAPLFGAAGSGYMNQGHMLSFAPAGSTLITGGAVGPEGSVFAFAAVIVGAMALLLTVPPGGRSRLDG